MRSKTKSRHVVFVMESCKGRWFSFTQWLAAGVRDVEMERWCLFLVVCWW